MSSGAATWLKGQRKTELVDLAEKVGLKDYESMKKADLETALDEHMQANSSKLSKDSSLSAYYKRIAPSPSKDLVVIDKKEKTPAAKSRRQTKAKEEIEADAAEGSSTTLATRTPKNAAQAKFPFPANVPLPASPRDVAETFDRQTKRVKSRLSKAYKTSGVAEYTDDLRDRFSSSASIETLALIVELLGLRAEILPMKFITTLPASQTLGTNEIPIKMPDFFTLVTANFWSTLMLWVMTSVAIPLTAAYFFNPTLKAKHGHLKNAKHVQSAGQYDPLTFNVMKALTMFLVYGKDVALFGWPSDGAKARVQGSVPGGYQGVLIASGIGALISVYEAVLKK